MDKIKLYDMIVTDEITGYETELLRMIDFLKELTSKQKECIEKQDKIIREQSNVIETCMNIIHKFDII